jgi:hypothetical protein
MIYPLLKLIYLIFFLKGVGVMDILFTDFISGINFGETQSFKNLQIIPLFTEGEEGKEEIRADYPGKLYRLLPER